MNYGKQITEDEICGTYNKDVERSACRSLLVKPEGRSPVSGTRPLWDYNIQVDLIEGRRQKVE
jgi:hypothetical protein